MSGESLRCFTEKDTDGPVNEGVAILGYGNLGRSFALNLRDAGLRDVTIGNIEDDYAGTAHADGFRVQGIAEASRSADLVVMLLPDEIIPEIFAKEIVPNLSPGTGLVFASGYCLAYKLVVPPPGMDVLMLAPRMGVEIIRRRYQNGDGFHSFLSVEQDASGKAWQRLLGLAKAVGALRAGAFALDARSEANLDLFIEQRLGAVVGFAIMSAFSIGVESGLPPEALALELYMSGEMETVWRGFRSDGFQHSAATHGDTAKYGGLLRTMQLFQTDLYSQFEKTLEEIRSGGFAGQFQAERAAGYPVLSRADLLASQLDPLTNAEHQLRTRMNVASEVHSASTKNSRK